MKLLISLLFLSFLWTSCQKNVDCAKLHETDGTYLNKKGIPFTGICTQCTPEGQVTLKMELKDGKRHGEFLRFFPDGKPGLISEYMDGVQTGIYQAYFSNGKIKEKRFKKDSIFVAVSWLENGSLYSISEEKGDTVFHGRMAYFNTDKSVQSIFRYKNGAKDGTFAICHENGKMNYTGSYKNDLTDGVWLQFFESGKLKGIEVYDKGKRTGTWKYFHENGKLFSRIIFSNNRIYKKTEWDENGNKTDEFSRE